MDRVKEVILSNNITLIITIPMAKSLLITNILNELSIKDKYKVVLFSFNIRCEYYFQKLISFLSGINFRLVNKYFYPYATINKNNKEKIERDKFIDTIEIIQNSNILMINESGFIDREYIDYILNYEDNNVLIIDNFYTFLNKKIYDMDELFQRIKREKNKHYVFLVVGKKEEYNKIINKFNKYINSFILVDGNNYLDYKDIFIKIKNNDKENNLSFKFDKINRIIQNMEEDNE